ncbi:hypothetical protein AGMMS4956_21410 [Bacteroidia bacterium]|nr:hypothetical protein AGMMS4956_21410 [Bacteroidia bacterium]
MKNSPEFYTHLAIELGAEHALRFGIDDIVFDARSLLKCMFGCEDWGRGHTCPSIIAKTKSTKIQNKMYKNAHSL